MSKKKKSIIEFRSYQLPPKLPVLLLTGEHWFISDVPSSRLHIHNCMEIGLCHSGAGILRLQDSLCPFHSQDITVISCNVPHTTYSLPDTTSQWSYLFVDAAELMRPLYPQVNTDISALLSSSEHHLSLVLKQEAYPVIHDTVAGIMQEMAEKKSHYQSCVRGLFLVLLTQLSRLVFAENRPLEQSPANILPIAPALDFISQHFSEEFSVQQLADMCSISLSHFRRIFTSIMGVSPLQYLHAIRIQKAAHLLLTTNESILSISGQTGFCCISSFNRQFSAIMGVTPTKWRKQQSFLKNQSVLPRAGWRYSKASKKPKT